MRLKSLLISAIALTACCFTIIFINRSFPDERTRRPNLREMVSTHRNAKTGHIIRNTSIDGATADDTGIICQSRGLNYPCRRFSFSKKLLPRTALFSFPGSGNTWTRHLIQQITGIYTGSVYKDDDLKLNGFPGEGTEDGYVVVIKTHIVDNLDTYQRLIILMRNPFDALLSEFKRLNGGHTSNINKEVFEELNLRPLFSESLNMDNTTFGIDKWLNHTITALKTANTEVPSIIVHYENLKSNLKEELIKIGHFLGLTISPDVLHCTLCNAEGKHHRKTERFNPYYEKDLFKLTAYLKAVNETLREICGGTCTLPYSTPSLTDLL